MVLPPPDPDALAQLLTLSTGMAVAVIAVTALSAGAASDTFALETSLGPLVFQRSPATQPTDGAMPKPVQARLQQRVAAAGIAAPAVLAISEEAGGLGQGFVMPLIAGETLPGRYLASPVAALLGAQCAAALARLHAMELEDFTGLPIKAASPLEQLFFMEKLYRDFAMDLPVFELAFAHLKQRLPPAGRQVLVHGDFRSGNFIVDDQGLAAVLDWELAHIGDPLEDLGWICVNSWRFGHWDKPVGGFAQREDFYAAYGAAGGHPVDPALAFVWEMFGTLRWGLSCLQLAHQHKTGQVVSVERAAIGRRVSEVELDLLYQIGRGPL